MSNIIKIPVSRVEQGDAAFYIGKMYAKDLLNIFTVQPAKYDLQHNLSLRDTFGDDEDYFTTRIERIKSKKKSQDELADGFQREASGERVRQIAAYLNKKENFALFPNAIIATCELMNDYTDVSEFTSKIDSSDSSGAFLEYVGGEFHTHTLHVSNVESSIIVIDGQHRILGIEKSDVEKSDFELLISFILEEDRSIIAKHFYTINYTQKGVNKSLLYQLMGEFSTDLQEISYMHELVMALNESESSPLFKRIKMLGKTESTFTVEERSLQTMSQAFVIDYLIYSIIYDANFAKRRTPKLVPIFYWYYKNSKHGSILKFIIRYFAAFQSLRPDMKNSNSPLGKTLGVGAMLQLMSDVYVKLFAELDLARNPNTIDTFESTDFESRLKGIENLNLDEFLSGGAAGVGRLRQGFFDACPWLSEGGEQNIKELRKAFVSWLGQQFD